MAEGGIRFQTRAAGRSPAQARELGRHRRFVPRPAGDCNAICREGIKTNLCGSSRILGWRRCRHSYRAARTRLRRLSVAIGRVASITGQARSTLTRENGQPTDSNLAQPSSVILLRARTPIVIVVLIMRFRRRGCFLGGFSSVNYEISTGTLGQSLLVDCVALLLFQNSRSVRQ